jgi:hypothetical protein
MKVGRFRRRTMVNSRLITLVAFASTLYLAAQSTPSATSIAPATSDPAALAIVQTAITTLGGQLLWQQAGGATAQVTISPASGAQYTVGWTDDWSTDQVRFRRDHDTNGSSQLSLVGSGASQTRLLPGGKATATLPDNGIAVLAIGYPGAALALSLSPQYACTFSRGQLAGQRFELRPANPEDAVITEFCRDPFYPGGVVPLVWEFPKNGGVPLAVELPIWGLMSHSLRTQTVKFTAFQNVDSLVIPSHIQIRRPSGVVDNLTISGTTFTPKLPGSLFQVSN